MADGDGIDILSLRGGTLSAPLVPISVQGAGRRMLHE
jgi:hypothetical protein